MRDRTPMIITRSAASAKDHEGGVNWCPKCWHWNKDEKKCVAEAGDFCKVLNDYFGRKDNETKRTHKETQGLRV